MMMMMKNKKVIDCLWWRRWWSCWRGGGWLSLHFFTKSRMEFYPNGCAATKKDFTPSIGSAKTWSETKPEISPGFRVNVFVLGFKCAWKTLESVPFCLGNWICWFYGFDFCWWVSIIPWFVSVAVCVCYGWPIPSRFISDGKTQSIFGSGGKDTCHVTLFFTAQHFKKAIWMTGLQFMMFLGWPTSAVTNSFLVQRM